MADQNQMIFAIESVNDDAMFDAREQILRLFEPVCVHTSGYDCDCQPEIFLIEIGARRIKHRKDC